MYVSMWPLGELLLLFKTVPTTRDIYCNVKKLIIPEYIASK